MTKMISISDWLILKTNFSHIVNDMTKLEIGVNRFDLFTTRKRKKKKTKKQIYGERLGEILEWLDENSVHAYYAEFERDENGKIKPSVNTMVKFYFMDETDAFAFKLLFDKEE